MLTKRQFARGVAALSALSLTAAPTRAFAEATDKLT